MNKLLQREEKENNTFSLQLEEEVLVAHVGIESLCILLTRCVSIDALHRVEIIGRVNDFRTVDCRHVKVLEQIVLIVRESERHTKPTMKSQREETLD